MKTDDEGFDDFYRSSFDKVVSAVTAFGAGDEAFDITQEAFARALVRWDRLRAAPWAEGWVMTTAMNLCRKRGRRLQRAYKDSDRAGAPVREDDLVHAELILAIRRLPHRQREAVVLFYLADHPISQVAELMRISEGAVKAHLSQARAKLRRRLEPKDA